MSDAVKCKEAKTHRTIQIPFSSEACFFASIVFGFSLNLFFAPLSLPLSLPIHYLFEICMEEPRSPAACLSWLLAGNYWSVNWRLEPWGG